MAIKDSRKSYCAITGAQYDGSSVAGLVPDAWAASETYKRGDMVLVATGKTTWARCKTPHDAVANGLTLDASDDIEGTQATNWDQVPTGTFSRMLTWTINEATTETTYQELADDGATPYSSARTDTITLTGHLDPEEKLQGVFRVGTTATLKLFPHGTATGLPEWTAPITVGSYDSSSNTEGPVQFTANLNVSGAGLDRTGVQS